MPSTISAGTTAGTAIAIAGDTTGNLAFQTNGTTTAMTIDTSQNVSIGTVTQGGGSLYSRLKVKQNANTNLYYGLHLEAASTDTSLFIANDGSAFQMVSTYGSVGSYQPITLWTGGSERMRIAAAGQVTMPFQPAFRANRSSGTSVASGVVVPYDSEQLDVGSNYNTSTYRFTAPVTGVYAFQFTARNTSSGATIYVVLQRNGSNIGPALEAGTTGTVHATCSTILALNANDYVNAISGSSGTQVDGSDSFSGYLIG